MRITAVSRLPRALRGCVTRPPPMSCSFGGGAAACGGNSNSHSGYLKKKGFVDVDKFYKINQGDPNMYCYKDETQTFRAVETINLSTAAVLTDFGMSPPALIVESEDKKWLLQTADEGEILPWLKAMEQSGVNCLNPVEDVCESAACACNIYDFEANDIDGNLVKLDKYKGYVTLIVNVASEWGLTDLNYTQLQQIYSKYKDEGLRIMAFPCNQFGKQEPGSEQEIVEFVSQYGVTFDLFSKVEVNGKCAIPLYQFLKSKLSGSLGSLVRWNFQKFLVDRKGVPQFRYEPNVTPETILEDIKKLL